jgi:hypothetical protein
MALLILFVVKMKYTTLRYKIMTCHQNLKIYIKKNDVYILSRLNKLHLYINKIVAFFDSNIIVQELIQANKLPIRFVMLLKNILSMFNKLIIFIINKIK